MAPPKLPYAFQVMVRSKESLKRALALTEHPIIYEPLHAHPDGARANLPGACKRSHGLVSHLRQP